MIVAIQRRKAGLTAGSTSILSKFISSLINSFAVSFNQSAGAVKLHSDDQSGGIYCSFSASLDSNRGLHSYHASISRYQLPNDPSMHKFGFSVPTSFNEGINLKIRILLLPFAFLEPCHKHVSSAGSPTILRQARNPAILAEELENALEDHRIEDAWKGYQHYKELEGFPRKSLLNMLISVLAYTRDLKWLDKAYALVLLVIEEKKRELLDRDSLTLLCVNLARAEMPVPSSTILRTMVEMQEYPPVNMWSTVIAHMAKTENGAYLASEIVSEMSYFFKDGRVDPRKKSNNPLLVMKPDTTAFNIALNASLVFGLTRKAEQLLELMPRVGVKANATSFAAMAQIYEKNGRRDELKKLKRHIDEAPGMLDHQYQQFYSSLLMSHLNFGDLDAASELVLDILKRAKAAWSSLNAAKSLLEAVEKDTQKPGIEVQNAAQIGDDKLPQQSATHIVSEKLPNQVAVQRVSAKEDMYFIIRAEAEELLKQALVEARSHGQLVNFENRILVPNEKIYAKLVKGYLEAGRVNDLAQFLIKVQQEEGPVSAGNTASAQVIDACIDLGWLDQAHDILDEMNGAEVPIGVGVYSSLLKAYCKANRPMEAAALLKEVKKVGLQLDRNCYDALIESHLSHKDLHGALDLFKEMREAKLSSLTTSYKSLMNGFTKHNKPNLMAGLLDEIKQDQQVNVGVHDWNSVIHFFCKAHLMYDAEKSLKKMKNLGYQPNAQTFHSIINGYSAAGGKYKEIEMLWTDMKMLASEGPVTGVKPLKFDQELLDTVLYNFVRGGFFERALEVISMMEQQKMFIDKFKYRQVFLKFHRNLYKSKKAPKAQTEAQLKRREEVLAFKKYRAIRKKLQQIEILEMKQANGHSLDDQQRAKLQTKHSLENALTYLESGVATELREELSLAFSKPNVLDGNSISKGDLSRKRRCKDKKKSNRLASVQIGDLPETSDIETTLKTGLRKRPDESCSLKNFEDPDHSSYNAEGAGTKSGHQSVLSSFKKATLATSDDHGSDVILPCNQNVDMKNSSDHDLEVKTSLKGTQFTQKLAKKKSKKGGLSVFLSGALDDAPKVAAPAPVTPKVEGPAWGGARITKGPTSLLEIQSEQIVESNIPKTPESSRVTSKSISSGRHSLCESMRGSKALVDAYELDRDEGESSQIHIPLSQLVRTSAPIAVIPKKGTCASDAEKCTPPWAGTSPLTSRSSLREIQMQQVKQQQSISQSPKTKSPVGSLAVAGSAVFSDHGPHVAKDIPSRWFKPEANIPSSIRCIQIEEKAMKDLSRFYKNVKLVKNDMQ